MDHPTKEDLRALSSSSKGSRNQPAGVVKQDLAWMTVTIPRNACQHPIPTLCEPLTEEA